MIASLNVPDYQEAGIQAAVDKLFALLDLDKSIRPEWKVAIKPNLVMKRRPEEGTTTHPAVVKAIIRHLQGLGVEKITIADSPGGVYSKPLLTGLYQATGMEQVSKETGAALNFDTGSVHLPQPRGEICKVFDLIVPIAQADFVISAAKLKSHCMTGLSGGVKNLFGCIPGLTKPEFHWRYPKEEDFCKMLVDLCDTVKPGVTFVDAVTSMEGDGPSSGELRDTGLLLAADDPYQLDLALAHVIHRDPDTILTIAEAKRRGFCPESFGQLKLAGDPLPVFADFRMPKSRTVDFQSNIPKPFRGFCKPIVEKFFTPRPAVDKKRCVGCGRCAESCPAHTIAIVDKKAVIDRSKCIRCYCCHELCPIHAISVKRNPLLDL